ncbi:uncharacterized protein FTOL_04709 [Fusarium torulosum]|uniref:Uncharacterized protein n=1 Tax=Fusarium torulosum TaxID=33205 RepID=A0AAE8M7J6_9HYPO|nr:uncharacterized protein FTOL_04709 [Fusarium torulosum]
MRLRFFAFLVIGVIAFDDSYEPFPEPYPTCADCLPASVHDAPGIGFSLSISSGTIAAHFYNGTVRNIAVIAATSDYAALMARLAISPPPPPLSRWEKWRRSLNKKIGRPATPNVGVIASMLISLRDAASTAVDTPDRVAVSHPRIQGLAEYDLWDAIEFAHLRPWVAADLPRPKLDFPLPAAGAYPDQLTEAHAVFAAHGKGLCEHFKHYWNCQEEEYKVPLETTLVVGFTPTDLRGEIIRTRSSFTSFQPRKGDRTFVDLGMGLDSRGTLDSELWPRITNRLQDFTKALPGGLRLDEILLTGENATHPAFLDALNDALVGNGYVLGDNKNIDAGTQLLPVKRRDELIDPAFASARGAAQYARWRQEAPIGCQEQARCEKERREADKQAELR